MADTLSPDRASTSTGAGVEGSPSLPIDRPTTHTLDTHHRQVLATASSATTHHAFALLPARQVFSHKLIVFPSGTGGAFCALQSRPHEIWRRSFGSTLGDGLTYNPSDVFETFPFPEGWSTAAALDTAGQAYLRLRADLMVRNDEGLTKTYNRFHDPNEHDPDIARLRELHAAMDRAVLSAYGWFDIDSSCEFLLDFEIDEEEWGRKRKPYRYRWPDPVRDEVLGRLLALNAGRAEEERKARLTS